MCRLAKPSGVNVTEAFRVGLGSLRRAPAAVLPFSLAGSAAVAAARVGPFLGLAAAYALLASTGRIAAFKRQLSGLSIDVHGAEPATVSQPDVAVRVGDAAGALVTPGVVAVVALSVALGLGIYVVAAGFAAAAEVGAVATFLDGATDRDALAGGFETVRSRGWTLVGVIVARALLFALPYLVGGAFALALYAGGSTVGAAAVGVLTVLAGIVWDLAVYVVTLFAAQAAVVDELGVAASFRRSAGFLRDRPVRVVAFVALSLGISVLLGLCTAALSLLSITRVAPLVSLLAVAPVLAVTKTGLYVDTAPRDLPERPRLRIDSRRALGGGVRAVGRFVRDRPGLHTLSVGLVALGFLGGYWATAGLNVVAGTPPADYAAVFGPIPVDVFLDIAANNWTVAIDTAFSGLGFGVPAATGLLFNGLLVGAVAHLGYPPRLVVAFLVPHGIVEIPALVVSGALGLDLGGAVWAWARGRADPGDLSEHLVHALRVLAGLLPFFVLAAFVEAFVTPWVAVLAG